MFAWINFQFSSFQTAYGTNNPVWEDAFTFFIQDPRKQDLDIQVFSNLLFQYSTRYAYMYYSIYSIYLFIYNTVVPLSQLLVQQLNLLFSLSRGISH